MSFKYGARHLCLRQCPYTDWCPTCGVCVPQAGPCCECRLVTKLLPPRPVGRGLDAVRKELGLESS